LTDQSGSPYNIHTLYDATTNRVSGESADANGNIGNGTYDVENRLMAPTWLNNTTRYAYAPDNKRVWRGVWQTGPGAQTADEITFWSVTGQRVGMYSLMPFSDSGTLRAQQTSVEYYFGGKLVKNSQGWVHADRLGSVGKYYPYGQERPSATGNGVEKFATYFRDAETGLDYAVNRYQAPGQGRFLSPDRYVASGGPKDPGSWNRYGYTRGDPVNRRDPNGTCDEGEDEESCGGTDNYSSNGASGLCEAFAFPTVDACQQAMANCDAGDTADSNPAFCEAYGSTCLSPMSYITPTLKFAAANQQSAFQTAAVDALYDVAKDNCRNVYGDTGNALQIALTSATYSYNLTQSSAGPDNGTVLARTSSQTQTVTINIVGGFFGPAPVAVLAFGGYQATLSADQFRTYVLLHELGHLVGLGTLPDANNYDNAFNMGLVTDCLGVSFTRTGGTP
jgi:RHS repeat-associated protein